MELKSTKKTIENKDSLPLVVTHNPNNPQIIGKIKEDLKFLNNSHKMKRILDKANLIISRRQPKNLKQHLTKAHFSLEKPTTSISRCHESRCGTCDIMITGNSITLKNGKHWQIKTAMDCKSKNVIYIIICPECESFYVGQIKNLRKRVTLHKEQIKHGEYRPLDISEHIGKQKN